MKELSELRAEKAITTAVWQEQRGIVASVQQELRPGLFVYVSLGSAGLKVFRGDVSVGIELGELVKLALKAEPTLGVGETSEAAVKAALANPSGLAGTLALPETALASPSGLAGPGTSGSQLALPEK